MSTLQEVKAQNKNDKPVNIRATEGGVLITTDLRRHWTAKGYGWSAMATSAIASLIIRPTGTAIITFFNNTSKNFIIERVFAHNLVSLTDGQFGIWLCVHPVGMTAPAGNDISIRNNLNVNYTAGTEGIFDVGETVNDNGWFPYGESNYSITNDMPGSLAQAFIEGRIVIPPTAAISATIVAQTAADPTRTMGLTYFSVPVDESAID